jgi:nitrogen fixation NifU-like protein
LYSETLLEHFQSPKNSGSLDSPDAEASGENPVCGDSLRLQLRVVDGVIRDARWQVEGCAPAIAVASAGSELLRGMALPEARRLDRVALSDAVGGLPPRKAHAAILFVQTLRQALSKLPAGVSDPGP